MVFSPAFENYYEQKQGHSEAFLHQQHDQQQQAAAAAQEQQPSVGSITLVAHQLQDMLTGVSSHAAQQDDSAMQQHSEQVPNVLPRNILK